MQEAYRQPSYYEGGACGYADTSYTAQESALRATFKRLLHNLARPPIDRRHSFRGRLRLWLPA